MFGNVTNYRVVKSNSFLAARVERTKNFRCVACDVNTTVSTLSLSRRHFCVPWSLSILLPLYLSLSPPPPPFNALSFSFQTSLLFLAVTFRLFLFTSIRISVYLSCYSCHSVIAPCLPLNDFPPFSQIHALSLFLAFPHRIRLLPLLFSSSKIISVFFLVPRCSFRLFCSRSIHLSFLYAVTIRPFLDYHFANRPVLVFLAKHGSLGPLLLTSGWGTPAASSTEGYPVDSTHLHLHQPAASVLRMRGKSRIRVYLFVCTAWIYTHTQSMSHTSMWLKRCSFRFCSKCITFNVTPWCILTCVHCKK